MLVASHTPFRVFGSWIMSNLLPLQPINHLLSCRNPFVVSFRSGPFARHMNLMDLQRAAEQGRRGKMGTFPAGSVTTLRLDEALEWAAGALAKIQVSRSRV